MLEEIKSCEAAMQAAMLHSDTVQMEALIDDNLQFVIPGGMVVDKAMDLENYRTGGMQVSRLELSDSKVDIHENVAIVSATADMKGSFQGNPFEGIFKILRVWNKKDGQWKVIAGSSAFC